MGSESLLSHREGEWKRQVGSSGVTYPTRASPTLVTGVLCKDCEFAREIINKTASTQP